MSREQAEAVQVKYEAVDRESGPAGAGRDTSLRCLGHPAAEKGEPPVRDGARLADLLRRPRITYEELAPFDPERPPLPREIVREVEITIKYQGYIDRQLRQVAEMKKLETGLSRRTWTMRPLAACGWRPGRSWPDPAPEPGAGQPGVRRLPR